MAGLLSIVPDGTKKIIGDDERARGEVAIKDMRTGEQRSVKREDAPAEVL